MHSVIIMPGESDSKKNHLTYKGGMGVGGRPQGEGIYVCIQLIHVVQQKLAQRCKAIIFQ